jgi:hypothetical protein
VDVSADRDAVRWGATLGLHLEAVRDCLSAPMALARDSPSAMAVARLLSLAHRYVREPRQALQLQGERQKTVYQTWLLGARGQTAVQQRVLPAFQLVQDDAWASQQAQSLRVQQASQPAAPPPVQGPVPWARPSVLLARLALPQAQREPRVVSPPLAQRSLVEAPQVRLASSVQLLQPLPSLLFPLWQPLPLALLLRQRQESFSAPSPQRPQESSSSASSFP